MFKHFIAGHGQLPGNFSPNKRGLKKGKEDIRFCYNFKTTTKKNKTAISFDIFESGKEEGIYRRLEQHYQDREEVLHNIREVVLLQH